jgi:hypothetical protein
VVCDTLKAKVLPNISHNQQQSIKLNMKDAQPGNGTLDGEEGLGEEEG